MTFSTCRPATWLVAVLLAMATFASPARADSARARGVEGVWQGTLQAALRLVVKIDRDSLGGLAATMDSPDQGAFGLPIDTLAFVEDSLHFRMRRIGGAFAGRMSADGGEIAGRWTQGGFGLPLTLKRLEKAPEFRRPQEPQKPYPYDAEEIAYENAKAGVKLAGTLTLPRAGGPFPCALLITGSGPEDRDEAVFGHRPFLVLADHLTRHGIAVLRVDDRGVGGSTGSTMRSTSEDFASDAIAGIEFLEGRKEIDRRHIGLIGHSEGGLIAPMVAVRRHDVAFIVMLAGPGLPGDSILYAQGALVLKAAGASDAAIAAQRRLQEKLFMIVKQESDTAVAARKLRQVIQEHVAGLPEGQRPEMADAQALVEAQVKAIRSPWFRFFLTYDPRPALRQVKCPVLALNGEKDVQVPPRENLRAIEEALRAGGNRDHEVKQLPGLNHLFQTCQTGAVSEYVQIEETMAPAALEEIARWIASRTRSRR